MSSSSSQLAGSPGPAPFGRAHTRRLREIYGSAGWPCRDALEIELLAAGLLDRVQAPSGHESLRLTDAGVQVLAQAAEEAKSADPQKIAEVMHSGKKFQTVIGEISYDKKGDLAQPAYAIYSWKKAADGKIAAEQNPS